MTVVTPDYRRTRRLEAWWEGNEKALIVTLEPPREAGNRTLKRGNELWMYLRETETTIKIPPSMMLQSWMGSDFTYDDLVRESNPVRDYHIRLLRTDTLNGVPCYVLELVPKPEAAVVWGKLLYWVRRPDRSRPGSNTTASRASGYEPSRSTTCGAWAAAACHPLGDAQRARARPLHGDSPAFR